MFIVQLEHNVLVATTTKIVALLLLVNKRGEKAFKPEMIAMKRDREKVDFASVKKSSS